MKKERELLREWLNKEWREYDELVRWDKALYRYLTSPPHTVLYFLENGDVMTLESFCEFSKKPNYNDERYLVARVVSPGLASLDLSSYINGLRRDNERGVWIDEAKGGRIIGKRIEDAIEYLIKEGRFEDKKRELKRIVREQLFEKRLKRREEEKKLKKDLIQLGIPYIYDDEYFLSSGDEIKKRFLKEIQELGVSNETLEFFKMKDEDWYYRNRKWLPYLQYNAIGDISSTLVKAVFDDNPNMLKFFKTSIVNVDDEVLNNILKKTFEYLLRGWAEPSFWGRLSVSIKEDEGNYYVVINRDVYVLNKETGKVEPLFNLSTLKKKNPETIAWLEFKDLRRENSLREGLSP